MRYYSSTIRDSPNTAVLQVIAISSADPGAPKLNTGVYSANEEELGIIQCWVL